MRQRPYIFLSIVFFLVFGWFYYLGQRLVVAADLPPRWSLAAWIALAVPFCCVGWMPAVYWQRRQRRQSSPSREEPLLLGLAYYSLAFLSFLLLLVWSRDFAEGIAVLLWRLFSVGRVSRVLEILTDRRLTLALIAAAGLMVWLGKRGARALPSVHNVKVRIPNLPRDLEGFTVAQLSDLHVGGSIRRGFIQAVVDRVNSLGPDLIAITGDVVDGTVQDLKDDVFPLSKLSAKSGVYYVTGNHEYYWGAGLWVAEMKRLGIRPLHNRHEVIVRGTSRLIVAGTPDVWASRLSDDPGPDAELALLGAPEAQVRILLAHQPKMAFTKGAEKFDLQLSGHTHGGQFLPWTLFIYFFHQFVRGLHHYKGRWIFVSRGTGYWGPPVRLGSASEITLLRLTKA